MRIGLIPCAGVGSRMGLPYPKELLTYNGKSFLQYAMELLVNAGVEEIVAVVSPNRDLTIKVLLEVASELDVKVSIVYQPEPLGLLDVVARAYDRIRDEDVLFVMPDTYVPEPTAFKKLLVGGVKGINFGAFRTGKPSRFDVLRIVAGKVVDVLGKPDLDTREWVWGLLAWSPSVTNAFKNIWYDVVNDLCNEHSLVNVLSRWVKNGGRSKVHKFKKVQYHDMATLDDYYSLIRGDAK